MLVSMSTLSWALLLLCLPEVGLGKNIGPRPRHASLPSTREGRPGITVPSDHEFFANYAKNFSWFDEDEHRNLLGLPSLPSLPRTSLKDTIGIGPAGLQKRINTVVGIAPDNCLACADGGVGLEEADVSWLTTPYLQAQMLKTPADLQNNCLFYSAIFKPADYALWLTKYPPFPAGVDPALSEFATTYACSSYMVTIWMLWPGKSPTGEFPSGTTNPNDYNYWEAYVAGSWLNPVVQKGQVRTYFENMSRAMAASCGGTIRVLSLDPTHLTKYTGTIWQRTELIELSGRAGTGQLAPNRLIAINALDTTKQYELDWEGNAIKSNLKRDDPDYWDFKNMTMVKRSACDANVAYQTAQGSDWFG